MSVTFQSLGVVAQIARCFAAKHLFRAWSVSVRRPWVALIGRSVACSAEKLTHVFFFSEISGSNFETWQNFRKISVFLVVPFVCDRPAYP